MSFPGAMMKATKLDEATGRPEATIGLPFAPHKLAISIEWPLAGAAECTAGSQRVPNTHDSELTRTHRRSRSHSDSYGASIVIWRPTRRL